MLKLIIKVSWILFFYNQELMTGFMNEIKFVNEID
jgi:hypothetical protein